MMATVLMCACHRYSVMAGTPDKMLEHLLETKIGKMDENLGNVSNKNQQEQLC